MRFPQSDAGLHGSRVTAVSRVLHIRATRVRPRRVGFERKHARTVDRHSGSPPSMAYLSPSTACP